MEAHDRERQINVLRLLQREKGEKRHKITPEFVLRYGGAIRDVLNENPFIDQPEELIGLIKLRTGIK